MPPPVKVLVVDDEPLIRWSLSEALADRGFDVTVAGDGRAAVTALGDGPLPDVVLLDYKLPDSNGLTLFQTIRGLVPTGQVILMTAFGTPEVTTRALALGAYRVVTKPFEVDEMAAMIRHAHGAAPQPDESSP
jgi:two-component system response regulator AtoC